MRVAVAQIAPVLLDRERTLDKVIASVESAGKRDCELVAFGEALVPGYPSWVCRADGARWDALDQKELFALYSANAVQIEAGHLKRVCDAAKRAGTSVVLGIIERPQDRGGHSLYATCVVIAGRGERAGKILSAHRKLMPTYEERLVWSTGDGVGLESHDLGAMRMTALNCWENMMPLARAAMYAAGTDVHVMLWPGSLGLTQDNTRFIAREGRCFAISACGLLRAQDVPASVPHRERFCAADDVHQNGGSCIAGPDGEWIVEPVVGREELLVADLEPAFVARERHNFDPSGHYARPDVLRLIVDRRRQSGAEFVDPR